MSGIGKAGGHAQRTTSADGKGSEFHAGQLESIINNSPAIVYVCRAEPGWPVEYISDNVAQTGYRAADFIDGRVHWRDLAHPDDARRVEAEAAFHTHSGANEFTHQCRIKAASGEWRWIEIRTTAIRDTEGRPLRYQGIILDITDRKKSETATLNNEIRLELAMKSAELGWWDCTVATDEWYVSSHWYSIFGLTPESVDSIGQYWQSRIHPDDADKVARTAAAYLDGSYHSVQLEYRILHSSGEWRWVMVNGKTTETDAGGKPRRITGTVCDITARKSIEELRRGHDEKLQLCLDGCDIGIWDWNLRDNSHLFIHHWAEILGYAPGDIQPDIHSFTRAILHPDDLPKLDREVAAFRDGTNALYEIELRLRNKAGEWRWMMARGRGIERDANGRPLRALGIHIDITARKEMQRENSLYHDRLRTLSARLAMAEETERRRIAINLHDGVGQLLAICTMKLNELTHAKGRARTLLLEDLRAMLKDAIVSARSLTAQLSPPVLYELGIEAALEWLTEYLRAQTGMTIEFRDDKTRKHIADDVRSALFQCAREALINTLKHAEAKRVVVAVSHIDHSIKVEIEDDGRGFDTALLHRSNRGDSGMGLFTIFERLDFIGGKLILDSAHGKGTRVTMIAPLAVDGQTDEKQTGNG